MSDDDDYNNNKIIALGFENLMRRNARVSYQSIIVLDGSAVLATTVTFIL